MLNNIRLTEAKIKVVTLNRNDSETEILFDQGPMQVTEATRTYCSIGTEEDPVQPYSSPQVSKPFVAPFVAVQRRWFGKRTLRWPLWFRISKCLRICPNTSWTLSPQVIVDGPVQTSERICGKF